MRASQRSLRLAMINRATERRGCRRREGTGHRRGDGERTVLTHVTNARSASSCAGVPAMAAVDPRRLRGKLCVIPNCLPQADKRGSAGPSFEICASAAPSPATHRAVAMASAARVGGVYDRPGGTDKFARPSCAPPAPRFHDQGLPSCALAPPSSPLMCHLNTPGVETLHRPARVSEESAAASTGPLR